MRSACDRETISALLRMTVERGCTPHEAASAKERAQAIAQRLGLDLGQFTPRPEGKSGHAVFRYKPEDVTEAWAQAAKRRDERQRAYAERERLAKLTEAEAALVMALRAFGGHTAADLGVAFNLKTHTVRAMISRIRAKGIVIDTKRIGGAAVYVLVEPR